MGDSNSISASPAPVDDAPRRVGAVILAAGPGRGSGEADVRWAPVAGMPLLAWSVRAFEAAEIVAEIVVVAEAAREAEVLALARDQRWRKTRAALARGPRRRDALRSGLDALAAECEWVALHDGARPLVTPELITATVEAARAEGESGRGAAAAYEPVNETIKRVRDGVVVETPVRASLALLQTPQVFRRALLDEAMRAPEVAWDAEGRRDVADEAVLLLRNGVRVALVPGGHENVRVTGPEELDIVERSLRQRAAEISAET